MGPKGPNLGIQGSEVQDPGYHKMSYLAYLDIWLFMDLGDRSGVLLFHPQVLK